MKKFAMLLGVVGMLLGVSSAVAGEDLIVSFTQYRAGHYVPPIDNRIVVSDRPFPFYVVIKNTSDRATKVYEKKGELNIKHLEFEFTDAKGVKTLVKHKEPQSDRERGGYRMMPPAEGQVASVLLHAGLWDMSLSIPSDKDSEFTLRVIYVNKKKKVYSVPYKVTVKAM
jgi:hypothetical protein